MHSRAGRASLHPVDGPAEKRSLNRRHSARSQMWPHSSQFVVLVDMYHCRVLDAAADLA